MAFRSARLGDLRGILPFAAFAALLAGGVAVANAPQLGPDYFGLYSFDDSQSSSNFQLEMEQQSGKHFKHVSVFAMNLQEFLGDGDLSKQNTVFKGTLKAAGGKKAPKMFIVATVGSTGDTLQGTFEMKRHKLPTKTGTFAVSR